MLKYWLRLTLKISSFTLKWIFLVGEDSPLHEFLDEEEEETREFVNDYLKIHILDRDKVSYTSGNAKISSEINFLDKITEEYGQEFEYDLN